MDLDSIDRIRKDMREQAASLRAEDEEPYYFPAYLLDKYADRLDDIAKRFEDILDENN